MKEPTITLTKFQVLHLTRIHLISEIMSYFPGWDLRLEWYNSLAK